MHVITGLGTGGAETMLYRLLAELDPTRFRCRVVSLGDQGRLGHAIERLGIPVEALHAWPLPRSVRALWRLTGVLRTTEPQLIHGWMYHGNVAATAAAWLARLSCPVVWSIRQSLADLSMEKWHTALAIRLGARWSRRSARILYNSRASAEQHETFGYAADRTLIIPNGFDLNRFHPNPSAGTRLRDLLRVGVGELIVGHVARYHAMKDHVTLLAAGAQVCLRYPYVHFALIGPSVDRTNRELTSLLTDPALTGRVHLMGERPDVSELTPGFDVAVSSSSRNEGFPNAVGEAMACGVPCVVTDVGDTAFVVGECGVVVPPGSTAALAAGLEQLIVLDGEERRSLGTRARQRIADHFSLGHIVRQYERLYAEVTAPSSMRQFPMPPARASLSGL